jgi:hypothetical protein
MQSSIFMLEAAHALLEMQLHTKDHENTVESLCNVTCAYRNVSDSRHATTKTKNAMAASKAKVAVDRHEDDEKFQRDHLSAARVPNKSQSSICKDDKSYSRATGQGSRTECDIRPKSLINPEISEFLSSLQHPHGGRNTMGEPSGDTTLEFLTDVAVYKNMVEPMPPLSHTARPQTPPSHREEFDMISLPSLTKMIPDCPPHDDRPISPLNPEAEEEMDWLFNDYASMSSSRSVPFQISYPDFH